MPLPTVLALDLMDTVVRDPIFNEVPRRLHCTQAQLFQLLDGQAWVDFETGAIDEEAYLARMFSRPPPPGVVGADLRDTILASYRFVEKMDSLLAELHRGSARLWVLSNYSPWVERMRLDLQLDRFFEGYVVSCVTGYRKPDPRAYGCLTAQTVAPPERTLFVDDRQQNVDAARSLGMQAALFEGADRLRAELVRLGLLEG